MDHQKIVDTLNPLLRGELAATETYQQALDKFASDPSASELRSMHAEHRDTANEFRKHVHQFNGKPDQGSGAWGAFAKAVTGVSKIAGATGVLKALKEGEEHGIHSYESALKDSSLPQECKTLINSSLKSCRSHIAVLDRLMTESKH